MNKPLLSSYEKLKLKQYRRRTILSKSPKLTKALLGNQKLVGILNGKMFKGYLQIKKLSDPNFSLSRFMRLIPSNYYPGNEHYNIFYKKKFLSSLYKNISFGDSIMVNSLKDNTTQKSKSLSSSNALLITLNQNENAIPNNTSNDLRKNIFLNQNEMNIYSSIPFVLLNKLPDPYNPKSCYIMNKVKKSKFNKKSFRCSSKSSKNNMQRELLEKKKISLSQSDFLYRLSHNINFSNNIEKYNFIRNKGLYHAKTMTNIFLKEPKNQQKHCINDIVSGNNFNIKINIINHNSNKKQNLRLNLHEQKFQNFYPKNIDELHESIDKIRENLNLIFNDSEENDSNVLIQSKKENKSSQYLNSNNNNINVNNEEKDEIIQKKHEKFECLKSIMFRPKHKVGNYFLKSSNFKSYKNNIHNIQNKKAISKIFNKTPTKKQSRLYTINPDSHLLKSSMHSSLSISKKLDAIKEKQIQKVIQKSFTKEEINHFFPNTFFNFKRVSKIY